MLGILCCKGHVATVARARNLKTSDSCSPMRLWKTLSLLYSCAYPSQVDCLLYLSPFPPLHPSYIIGCTSGSCVKSLPRSAEVYVDRTPSPPASQARCCTSFHRDLLTNVAENPTFAGPSEAAAEVAPGDNGQAWLFVYVTVMCYDSCDGHPATFSERVGRPTVYAVTFGVRAEAGYRQSSKGA